LCRWRKRKTELVEKKSREEKEIKEEFVEKLKRKS